MARISPRRRSSACGTIAPNTSRPPSSRPSSTPWRATPGWIHIRKQNRFRLFAERYREEIPSSTDGGLARLRKNLDIQDALERLSPKLRETLVLAVHQALSYDEIADVLNVPVGTVKSRVFNALSTSAGDLP
jgi:RNA polymerase sigma factor (sigma-70 family)